MASMTRTTSSRERIEPLIEIAPAPAAAEGSEPRAAGSAPEPEAAAALGCWAFSTPWISVKTFVISSKLMLLAAPRVWARI